MSISSINPTAQTATAATGAATASSVAQLSPDAFLQLLVAQLQNQDPMNPADGTQFVTQLSQLTTLQQSQNLAATMQSLSGFARLGSAASLIGREVSYTRDDGTVGTGVVTAVDARGDNLVFSAGADSFLLGNLLSVATPTSAAPTTSTIP